jgi:hypothetical protein
VRDVQIRYGKAKSREEKGRIISEISENLRCHRKHAIRLLNGPVPSPERPYRRREPKYPERLIRVLEWVWEASFFLWSDRLKAALPLWLPWARKRWSLTPDELEQLLAMSPATMDRRLAPYRTKLGRKLYGQTKPGSWLRRSIPIQTDSWQVPEPGWTEIDTVSHSGPAARGLFAYTVNETDLFSGWGECRAVLGRGAAEVLGAFDEIRRALPFEQKGMDSDNGEEFINWQMERYCREAGIQRFRSRPYKKDDQAHIEQKNWTQVRKLIGWCRYDTQQAVDALNDLYRNELRLLHNLFLPSVKLSQKIRVGARLKRVYDPAKTPLDRLLASGQGNRDELERYLKLREGLDPIKLSRTVDKKLEVIWELATKTRVRPARGEYAKASPFKRDALIADEVPPVLLGPSQYLDIWRYHHQGWKDRLMRTT